jgi:hypothetical protein
MASMLFLLLQLATIPTPPHPSETAQRLHLELQEGEVESRWVLDLGEGAIRLAPESDNVVILLHRSPPAITLLQADERYATRLEPRALRPLVQAGIVKTAWFPWVYRVSPDLLERLSVRRVGGNRVQVVSEVYGRAVAEYQWEPGVAARDFFVWKETYLLFWSEGERSVDDAQRRRLALYDHVEGLPLVMEERFDLLTRPRRLRVVKRETVMNPSFDVPSDFVRRTDRELLWADFKRRIMEWFRRESAPSKNSR